MRFAFLYLALYLIASALLPPFLGCIFSFFNNLQRGVAHPSPQGWRPPDRARRAQGPATTFDVYKDRAPL
jgi:hypothetical protein